MASARRTARPGSSLEGPFLVGRRRAAQHREVGMGRGRDLARRRVTRVDRRASCDRPARRRHGSRRRARPDRRGSPCRSPAARRSARRGAGGRRRAPPGRPPRLRAWPKKADLLARMRRALELVRLDEIGVTRHALCGPAPRRRSRRSAPRRRPRSLPRPRPGAWASMTTQRSGSAAAMRRKASRRRWWKAMSSSSNRSAPSPCARRRAAARGQPGLGRQIEDEGQVGPRPVHDDALERVEELRLEPAVLPW